MLSKPAILDLIDRVAEATKRATDALCKLGRPNEIDALADLLAAVSTIHEVIDEMRQVYGLSWGDLVTRFPEFKNKLAITVMRPRPDNAPAKPGGR